MGADQDDYNFVSVVAVFYLVYPNFIWQGNFDSYKDAPGIHIVKEFTPEEFFSEDYAVQRGEWDVTAYTHHEKMIVPKEFVDLLILQKGQFCFAVFGVVFDEETSTYSFTVGESKSSYHSLRLSYQKLEDNKIRLQDGGR